MLLKRSLTVFTLLFVLGLLLLLTAAPITQAIGEVTPTPGPAEPTAVPEEPNEPLVPSGAPATPSPETAQLYERAIQQIQAGNFDEAIEIMDEALELEPRVAEGYLIRGAAYAQLNNFTRAIDDYTRAIDLIPYMWVYYLFRGNAYLGLNETGAAMRDFDRAIDLNPRYQEAYASRAFLHKSLGEDDASEIDTLIAQGLARAERGDLRGAIRNFTDAIAQDGGQTLKSASAYYNRGLVNFQLEDYEAALEDYTAALEIYPDMHDAYLGRGTTHLMLEDMRRAGSDYLRRIEILEASTENLSFAIGDSTDVMMSYGRVYRITFQGRGGDSVTIEARATDESGVDPLIAILDPSGAPIAGDDDTGAGISNLDSMVEELRLPADGEYTIVVSHANGGYDGLVRVMVK